MLQWYRFLFEPNGKRINEGSYATKLQVSVRDSLSSAYASPDAPGHVPPQVGNFEEAQEICALGDVPMPHWLLDIITLWQSRECREALEHIDQSFDNAYLRAESELASPGFPTSDIYAWEGVLVQEFSGGELGDGQGAIIAKSSEDDNGPQQPQYVGGGTWAAYERAIDEQGIQPGYPINLEHTWPGSDVTIQDFRGGSWGDAAIIGGDNAWLVAGRHWEAYWRVDGQIQLGNPTGPWHQNADGWYKQVFESGSILELNHDIRVVFNDGTTEELYVE